MLRNVKILCKPCGIVALLLNAHVCLAQFTDSFSDGDFTNNPAWWGDNAKFTIQSSQLRLSAPAVTDVAYLSLASQAMENASWEFTVYLDFDPSGSNFADVYLASDQSILTTSLNGYFVRIGNTSDEVSLYRQSGITKTKIIDGLDSRVTGSSVLVRVKAIRSNTGSWQLFSDVGVSGTYTSEGTVTDNAHRASLFNGVVCTYSATRSDDFYFDDFIVTGDPYVDPSTPADYKDIILTELFADPSPIIGLPDAEFVELHNRSTKIINLSGWTFTDGGSTGTLPGFLIQPQEYLILTSSASAPLFSSFGLVIGLSNFPTLNNAGDNLVLKRNDGLLIDQLSYTDGWYKDDDKRQGGYTLELIDPANPCGEESNWIASEASTGGTPGTQNSVHASKPDLTGPKLLTAIPESVSNIILRFDEKLSEELPATTDFNISPILSVSQVEFVDASLKSMRLQVSTDVLAGMSYTVKAQNIYDCNGNVIQEDFDSAIFGLPEEADSLDVVINEVLFNPRPTGVDFVEVYNNSSKFLNLKNWTLANHENGVMINSRSITTSDFLLPPGQYVVFTEDMDVVIGEYSKAVEKNFLEVADLPSLNDDEGSIAIANEDNERIDSFSYTDNFHSVFIDDDEGVSLERISFLAPSQQSSNWKSASSTSGFATPGYLNSNTHSEQLTGKITISPEVFEPVSGQPNFTQIQYSFEQGGNVANVRILDFQGREVKELANNATLGTEGFFRWDGDTEHGSKVRTGYYIVWVEIFNANGQVNTFRKRVVVAARQ